MKDLNRNEMSTEAVELFDDMSIDFINQRYEASQIAIECNDGHAKTLVFE